jgi:hypothetical protein
MEISVEGNQITKPNNLMQKETNNEKMQNQEQKSSD